MLLVGMSTVLLDVIVVVVVVTTGTEVVSEPDAELGELPELEPEPDAADVEVTVTVTDTVVVPEPEVGDTVVQIGTGPARSRS